MIEESYTYVYNATNPDLYGTVRSLFSGAHCPDAVSPRNLHVYHLSTNEMRVYIVDAAADSERMGLTIRVVEM